MYYKRRNTINYLLEVLNSSLPSQEWITPARDSTCHNEVQTRTVRRPSPNNIISLITYLLNANFRVFSAVQTRPPSPFTEDSVLLLRSSPLLHPPKWRVN